MYKSSCRQRVRSYFNKNEKRRLNPDIPGETPTPGHSRFLGCTRVADQQFHSNRCSCISSGVLGLLAVGRALYFWIPSCVELAIFYCTRGSKHQHKQYFSRTQQELIVNIEPQSPLALSGTRISHRFRLRPPALEQPEAPILAGSWDLVTTCNWAQNPIHSLPN